VPSQAPTHVCAAAQSCENHRLLNWFQLSDFLICKYNSVKWLHVAFIYFLNIFQYKIFGSETKTRMLEIANHVDKVPFQGLVCCFVCLYVNGCRSIVRARRFTWPAPGSSYRHFIELLTVYNPSLGPGVFPPSSSTCNLYSWRSYWKDRRLCFLVVSAIEHPGYAGGVGDVDYQGSHWRHSQSWEHPG
jgi:hypothetical protein